MPIRILPLLQYLTIWASDSFPQPWLWTSICTIVTCGCAFWNGGHWATSRCSGNTNVPWKLMSLLTHHKGASYGLEVHRCKFSHHSVSENNHTIFLCNYLPIRKYVCQLAKLNSMTIQNTSWEGYQSPLFLCPRFLWWIIKKNWTS